MARKPFIGGNWKSNGTVESVKKLVTLLNNTKFDASKVDVVVSPVFLHIPMVMQTLQKDISVSVQNVSLTGPGAYTGEVACEHVLDLGLKWTILGHSERRAYYHETDEIVAQKTKRALEKGLKVIFCIGETLDERKANQTLTVLERQTKALASIISEAQWQNIVIAYEPVWAIGTGVVATPAQAQEAHKSIRDYLRQTVSAKVADETRILYGGSVKANNCVELIALADVDGFLVGGASLNEEFQTIIKSAC